MQNKSKPSVQYVTVAADYVDQRIDNFLVTRLKGVPKSHIYKIVRKGEVRVNKKRIAVSYRLQEGDEIRIPPVKLSDKPIPAAPGKSLVALLKERILLDDKSLLIINKPSGIPVHGGSGVGMGLIEALRTMYPKSPHLELAHRLDADTSGCLVLAKKRSVLKEVHELLRAGKVKKIYQALTKGHWKAADLRVEAPLQKNFLASGERIVKVNKDGKASTTLFKIIQTFTDGTLVEAELLTGRTHQIRVHAQYRGHPIACDDKYGDKDFTKKMRDKGLKRLFLHAQTISFTLPSTGQTISVSAPLDEELEQCLANLKKMS